MLLVVAPNLAVDRILEVDGFRPSAVQRSLSAFSQPGGKGSNVARVFRQLGGDVVLAGLVGERNAAQIVEPLKAMGVHVEAIQAFPGESRTCTIIRDLSGAHPTVINEESSQIQPGIQKDFVTLIDRWLPQAAAVLVTGSLSSGLPQDFYRLVLDRARVLGIPAMIDATGPILREGLRGKPAILKANVLEAATVLESIGATPRDVARRLKGKPGLPAQTLVTFGSEGAVFVEGGKAWFCTAPPVPPVNPIGAGDSFAAGYLKACIDGTPHPEALRVATAVAAADVTTLRPGWIAGEDLVSLLASTSVEEW